MLLPAVTVTVAFDTLALPAADTPLLLWRADTTFTLPPVTAAVPVEYIPCKLPLAPSPVTVMAPEWLFTLFPYIPALFGYAFFNSILL